LLRDVPVNKVKEFEKIFLLKMEQRYADVLENFRKGKYDDADLAKVEALAKELSAQFK